MKYLSMGLRAFLAAVFIFAGGSKLAGVEMMVQTFEGIGVGQWFRYVTGAIEVGFGIAVWIPNRQLQASLVLGATMVGAILAHLLILGPSAVPATVLLVLLAIVAYLHRDQDEFKTV